MLLMAAMMRVAVAQLSPGELSKAHSHLEGLSNCTKCHILGEKVSGKKCLDCHTELKVRVVAGKGYHASAEVKGKECVGCHSDHHGRNFQLIRFQKEKFNHDLTGYPLQGAHAKRSCSDCHKPANITEARLKKKSFTYLGLSTGCVACHNNPHRPTLGETCGDCHVFEAFKPASRFSHDRARFRLAGRHATVPCESCHRETTGGATPVRVFKGLSFTRCTDCHADPHGNRFGQECEQCHTAQSFTSLKNGNQFNHELTRFSLEGRHRQVTCDQCHTREAGRRPAFSRCNNCHTDYHRGQLTRAGITPDCSECHTTQGFATFDYTIERHNRGPFPLKGAQLATPCVACHLKDPAAHDTAWRFSPLGPRCVDCHNDIHLGKIGEKYYPGQDCRSCHEESRWTSVSFDHNVTGYLLEGAHTRTSCRSCHFRNPDQSGNHQFAGLPRTCSTCHPDVHAGQFDRDGLSDCGRCHYPETFIPASRFDHSKTLFPLEGKHRETACSGCHKQVTRDGKIYVLYKIKDFKCEDCHR